MEKSEKGLICASCEHCYHDLPARRAGRKSKLACLHPKHGAGGKPLDSVSKQPSWCPRDDEPKLDDKGIPEPANCVACGDQYPAKDKAKALCTVEQPAKVIDNPESIPGWCPRGYGKGKKAKADDGGDAGKGDKKAAGKKSKKKGSKKDKPQDPPADPPADGGSPPPGE